MKQILIAAVAGMLLFTGCKENHSLVDLSLPRPSGADTTYVLATVPATDDHNVLVEEFTGQKCSNCPAAHTALEALASAHEGRVNTIGLYFAGSPQSVPPPGSLHDFRDSASLAVTNTIYGGLSPLPSGGVDRKPVAGQILLFSNSWADAIASNLTVADSLNMSVVSTFDEGTNTATIKVIVTYTKPVTTAQNLSIVVVEDSMIDKQEFPTATQDGYLFTNVLRQMITPVPVGAPLQVGTSDSKEAGRVFERTYTYTPKVITPAIVPRHCRVITFVSNSSGTDYRVHQSVQCKLVP